MKALNATLVIPTKNSCELLKRHISDLVSIAEATLEVIVVDSSDDSETLDYLRKNLPPHTSYQTVPPGLYQAWNHAVSLANGKYVLFATSGDSLTLTAFKGLLDTAHRFDADIVVGPPRLILEDGSESKDSWPVHNYITSNAIDTPKKLRAKALLCSNLIQFPRTLIGSSANNVYKTAFLKQNPFPTDLGPQADAVWAVLHSEDAIWAIDPNQRGEFVIHASESGNTSKQELKIRQLETIHSYLQKSAINRSADFVNELESLLAQQLETEKYRTLLNNRRKNMWWIFSIYTWRIRHRLKTSKRRVTELAQSTYKNM